MSATTAAVNSFACQPRLPNTRARARSPNQLLAEWLIRPATNQPDAKAAPGLRRRRVVIYRYRYISASLYSVRLYESKIRAARKCRDSPEARHITGRPYFAPEQKQRSKLMGLCVGPSNRVNSRGGQGSPQTADQAARSGRPRRRWISGEWDSAEVIPKPRLAWAGPPLETSSLLARCLHETQCQADPPGGVPAP